MKVFKTIQMNLAMCFYQPNQTRIFDVKRLLVIFILISGIGSGVLFALFDADNTPDFVICTFVIVTKIGILISFIDTAIKTTEIFSLVDGIVNSIEISKPDIYLHCVHLTLK